VRTMNPFAPETNELRPARLHILSGRNRHGKAPVLECWLDPGKDRLFALENERWVGPFEAAIGRLLGGRRRPARAGSTDHGTPGYRCALLLGDAVIALQQNAGFQVEHCGALQSVPAAPIRFFAEFDDERACDAAIHIALGALESALNLADQSGVADTSTRADQLARLERLGKEHATPPETVALIHAAGARGVPCQRMDRPPFDPVEGAFRIRPNGLLRLGHARHRRTVDGTFCVERSGPLHGLVRDRVALTKHLKQVGLDLPFSMGVEPRMAASPNRAVRMARRVGFPVALKSAGRGDAGARSELRDEESVRAAAQDLLRSEDAVLIEAMAPGEVFDTLFVGTRPIASFRQRADRSREPVSTDDLPIHAIESIGRTLAEIDVMCVAVTLSFDRSKPEATAVIIDFDIAPRLDLLFGDDSRTLERAARQMLEWLFPAGRDGRIPVAAVTGTNGKTTTSLMLARILRESGQCAGLACSIGSFVDGRSVSSFEDGYLPGHLTVLDHGDVSMAVLETTRGGMLSTGIGFDKADVAACINVTNDHLDPDSGVATVEDMARIKQWIVERGRQVVLNADDPHCLAMARKLSDRNPVLVSIHDDIQALRAETGLGETACVLESVSGREWITHYRTETRVPIVAVDEIPATFDGKARHNVINAMHAAAMAMTLGLSADAIAAGLKALDPDLDQMPGRLNHYRAGGADYVVDYAHNPAGIAHLVDFCDQLNVAGRRIIAFTLPADRGDDFVVDGAAGVAGHFDLYICKNYRIRYGREPHEVPELMTKGLERAGVPGSRIVRIEDEDAAVAHALEISRPGDLVVLVVGKGFEDLGRRVQRFAADRMSESN